MRDRAPLSVPNVPFLKQILDELGLCLSEVQVPAHTSDQLTLVCGPAFAKEVEQLVGMSSGQ